MRTTFLLALAANLSLALPSAAQEIDINPDDLSDAEHITRPAVDFTDALRIPVPDRDSVDSAMVFTSKGPWATVKCVGLNYGGRVIGRIWTRIRPNGLRILFVSDLSNGVDVIGSVRCASRNRVVASGFVLAPGGIAQLPVMQRDVGDAVRMHFPVVASY